MNCPRCNANVAFSKKRCDNCGHDLKNYRKVVSLSNTYYNKGLSQAKVRDLSGAVSSLKLSLQYNKLNTNARNLLGLIYLEEGEIVAALSEWVISRHYQAENNDAEDYIRQIQSNPNRLETYNQTIRKYNSALKEAKNDNEDLAIIQLKKAVSLNPKFVRAYQLLALLYMKRKDYVKAAKVLKRARKIDFNNTTTLRYMQEIGDTFSEPKGKENSPKAFAKQAEKETQANTANVTPVGTYRQLIEWYEKGDLDFSRVSTVNLDEYRGLAHTDPQSYYYFMQENLFDHVNIDKTATHVPDGTNPDAADACAKHEQIIKSLGGIDLQLLGLGNNGHIGFNEPGAAFEKETHLVDLAESTIRANARFFTSIDEVPKQAYTMGIRTIMQAKKILVVVSGEGKADIVSRAFFGPVTPEVPASILQMHPDVTVVCDEAALSLSPL